MPIPSPRLAIPTHRLAPALPILTLLALGACAGLGQSRGGIGADRYTLEERGAIVFAQYQIPVAERRPDGRVRSGTFLVEEVWDRFMVADRVYCDGDAEGNTLAFNSRIRMSVLLRASDGRIVLSSEGRTVEVPEGGKAVRCRLSEPFVDELLTAIAGHTDDGIPGRPGVGPLYPPGGGR